MNQIINLLMLICNQYCKAGLHSGIHKGNGDPPLCCRVSHPGQRDLKFDRNHIFNNGDGLNILFSESKSTFCKF